MKSTTRGKQVTLTPIKEEAKSIVEDALVKFKEKNRLKSDRAAAKLLNISYPSTFGRFRNPAAGVGEAYAEHACRQLGLEPSKILDYTYKDKISNSKGNPNRLTSSSQGTCLEAAFFLIGYLKPKKRNTFTCLLNDHLARLVIQNSLNVTPKNFETSSNEDLCIIGGRITDVNYTQTKLVLQEMKDCFQPDNKRKLTLNDDQV